MDISSESSQPNPHPAQQIMKSMKDRELLELAAKSAGMPVLAEGMEWPQEKVGWFFNQVGTNPPALYGRASNGVWAPITDDADAFRLAIKLKINIQFSGSRYSVSQRQVFDVCCLYEHVDHAEDIRRSIVMAAAEIAKLAAAQPAGQEEI